MDIYLNYGQIATALLLIGAILLQQRGGGFTSLLGGSAMEYSTKRGAEKVVFYTTIVLAVIFIAISIARMVLSD